MQLQRPGTAALSRAAAPAALSVLLLVTACATGEAPPEGTADAAAEPRGRAADGDLEVTGAWVPEPANPEIAVLYLEVSNAADEDTAITGVSTGASPGADLCSTEATGSGASRMRVVDEIPVAAGGSTALVDGGYHIMVNDLPEPLEAGDEVAVALTFAGGRELDVTAPVQPRTADSGPVTDHGGHH